MKYLILGLLLLVGCADTHTETVREESSDNPIIQGIEGFYSLPNGGYIELFKSPRGYFIVFSDHKLVSKNYDSSLAIHSKLPSSQLYVNNGKLSYTQSSTLNANNNLKDDLNNNLITGTVVNEVSIYKYSDKLSIRIRTYNSSSTVLLTDRLIESI